MSICQPSAMLISNQNLYNSIQWPPDMDSSCKYTKYEVVTESRQAVFLQLEELGKGLTTPHYKAISMLQRTSGLDIFLAQPEQRKRVKVKLSLCLTKYMPWILGE